MVHPRNLERAIEQVLYVCNTEGLNMGDPDLMHILTMGELQDMFEIYDSDGDFDYKTLLFDIRDDLGL